MQDWLWATAADLGRGINRGEIDPVDLCEAYLAAIDGHDLRNRIYARVTHDRARSEAKAASARAKAGQRLCLLDGVPVSWKDLFDTAGIGTEAGTKLMEGRVPSTDAEVLRVATGMGLVCLGKTHMTEIAFSGLGYNPSTATPPCVNLCLGGRLPVRRHRWPLVWRRRLWGLIRGDLCVFHRFGTIWSD